MSRSHAVLGWLEDKSDWLSPIVVKEVRQLVSGREFMYAFTASLVAGLAIAFFGAAGALTGPARSGNSTFVALILCLTFLGLVVVPFGAASALRNERLEQTLELITLTALSPRRVVIGKLLAQGVKLATFFAAMAPFIAMSFLLGGIDFVTILISLLVLFMWSLWASAAGLFLSCLFKSRTMSGVVIGGGALVLFVVFGLSRVVFFLTRGSVFGFSGAGGGTSASQTWWALAITTSACLASMINLVLLAENRLSLATENRVTPLRIGFFAQFLLILGWSLSYLGTPVPSNGVTALAIVGGWHLAIVAMFTVTEDLIVPRRVLLQMRSSSKWDWLLAMFRPGGGRGALYVLVQMALLLAAAGLLQPAWDAFRWFLAICAYICFFTGVPVLVYRLVKPAGEASLYLRVVILLLVPISIFLPELVYYLFWRPEFLDFTYSARHLFSPLRTLANWDTVEIRYWFMAPLGMGLLGLVAYLALIRLGMTMESDPIGPYDSEAPAEEPGSADALY